MPDAVWLTGEQVDALNLEYDLLRKEELRIAERIREILHALHASGESKVRAMREAESWAADGPS